VPTPNDPVVFGIHSTVNPGTEGSFNQLVDGHAWLSVTRNGQTQVYGLWPDNHPNVRDNGPASDIRTGLEGGATATASRYYQLTPEQAATLETRLRENIEWRYGNTCASWAGDTVKAVTGERVQGSELFGLTDTPRRLIESIETLEQQRATSPSNPLRPDEILRSSSFGALTPDDLSPADRALYAQAQRAVGDGIPDAGPNVAANATLLARENSMGIDHALVGRHQNLMIVEGALDDPGHRRASMPLEVAQGRDAQAALQAMQGLTADAVAPQNPTDRLRDEPERSAPRLSV